jgi:hypothetical protein
MRKIYSGCCLIAFMCFVTVLSAQTKDWTTLFDGKTLSGWKKVCGEAEYTIEKGSITGITKAGSPNTFLVSEREYGDFVLELEVMMPDTGSNSGIQFRSHFDAQGNNSKGKVFGYQYELDNSPRAWTGGIYDEGRRGWLYPLDLNPAAKKVYKRGQFNKVKIECIGNTIKTWVNNVPIAYMVDDEDAKGLIALQVHGVSREEDGGKKI